MLTPDNPRSRPTAPDVEVPADSSGPHPLFRPEAVAHHIHPERNGAPLRISPRWAHGTYWVLLAAAACGLGFVALAHQREYATGPAVVRFLGYDAVTASAPGVVAAIEVEHGQQVAAGQILIRYEAQTERDILRRAETEYELELAHWLRDLGSPAHAALVQMAAEVKLARARVEQRIVRAPSSGTASDIRVRPGQALQAGEPILSVVRPDANREVVALVRAEYRPQLAAGQTLRLRLRGYERTSVPLTVTTVADEAIGPAEARRFLGTAMADAVPIMGAVVVVHASLPASTFAANGREQAYFPGMLGEADIAVRDQRLLFRLFPGGRS